MKQILVNLVQNAVDASPDGASVQVGIEKRGAQAAIVVRDADAGLDTPTANRLFEPGVTNKAKGSGLGLTIARSLARQHLGELTLVNHPGGGAEAVLTLPCERPS